MLAISVVLSHSHAFFGFFGPGGSAVPAFFIISGFYMSLILSNKYDGRHRIWLFYSNRALRLYPMYLTLLLIFVALAQVQTEVWPMSMISAAAANPLRLATDLSPPSLWAAIPNLTFFGSDLIRVFVVDTKTMTLELWAKGIAEGDLYRGMYQYLVIPPIWSLGVEVVFYLVAPAIVALRLRMLVVLALALLSVNVAMHAALRGELGWFHLLAPYNLVYFVIGVVAQKVSPHLNRYVAVRRVLAVVPFLIWAFWQVLPWQSALLWMYFILFAAGVPCLFDVTRKSALDTRIGSYSYPMYLCHTLFTWPMMPLGEFAGIAASVLAAALSFALLEFVDKPIEAWRQRRVTRPAAVAAGLSLRS